MSNINEQVSIILTEEFKEDKWRPKHDFMLPMGGLAAKYLDKKREAKGLPPRQSQSQIELKAIKK